MFFYHKSERRYHDRRIILKFCQKMVIKNILPKTSRRGVLSAMLIQIKVSKIKEISFKRIFIMNDHYKENIKIPDIIIHIPIILR
jgi:hypothetical protein